MASASDFSTCAWRARENHKMSVTITVVPTEIRTKNLQITNLEHYSYTNLFAGLLYQFET